VTVATINGLQNNLGWTTAKLQDVCDIIRGVSFSKDKKIHHQKAGYLGCLRTTNVQNKIEWDDLWYIPREVVKNERQILQKHDILISNANSLQLVGKVAQICDQPILSTLGAFISAIRVRKEINPKFVYFQLSSSKIRQELRGGASTTTNISNISTFSIGNLKLAIAPLSEQTRIVSKIEELFSFLDVGVESLRKVQVQLKRYRQAVLKYAFEGKLTEEWRRTHRDQIEPAQELLNRIKERRTFKEKTTAAQPVNLSNEFRLPTNWVTASLDELSEQIVDCLHSTPKFTTEGKYCIDTNCIEPNRILFGKARLVSEETFKERIRRLNPKTGDILFAREGTIGTAVVVPENVDLCIGQRMMMFRPDKEVNPSYFMLGLLSPFFERQWKTKVTGSTVAHVNVKDIRLMRLPLASVVEQELISKEVERYLSIADDLEKTLIACLLHSDLMRQSILKNAFEGKLVPQDPNDEPAEKLLERIKAERFNNMKFKIDNQVELSRYVK
jgi:type I restriction enzyme S subunit